MIEPPLDMEPILNMALKKYKFSKPYNSKGQGLRILTKALLIFGLER